VQSFNFAGAVAQILDFFQNLLLIVYIIYILPHHCKQVNCKNNKQILQNLYNLVDLERKIGIIKNRKCIFYPYKGKILLFYKKGVRIINV